ncbi:hypothetical protein [Pandoraea oxalativorans]|uniref:hypothetical protein n=1 Tax=Pandoraea oxalativorans TaxID=573737 RepID=UPI000A41D0EF|nr:hypothetical protein [Pandoraea oxalativorans]
MSEVLAFEFTLPDELSKYVIPTGDTLVSWVPSIAEHAQYAAQYAVTLMGIG